MADPVSVVGRDVDCWSLMNSSIPVNIVSLSVWYDYLITPLDISLR